jgi:hypothetical protein
MRLWLDRDQVLEFTGASKTELADAVKDGKGDADLVARTIGNTRRYCALSVAKCWVD